MAKWKGNLSFIDFAAISLADLAEGDFSHLARLRLAARLRLGFATREEHAVAADIITGKLKAPPNRPPRDWDKVERDLDICRFIGRWCMALAKVPPKKAVVAAVLDAKPSFNVSRSTIYEILRTYGYPDK
jgi:hypothetical protein